MEEEDNEDNEEEECDVDEPGFVTMRAWEGDLDKEFPAETPEGQSRIYFFRKLKKLLKSFGGRHSFHNFATGGACPEEAAAVRILNRMYHKDLLVMENNENWVVFSVSGDGFLRGQVRKLIGLALSIVRGWLPEWYLDVAVSASPWQDTICDVPLVPKEGLYLAENRYAIWETKHVRHIDPRRYEGTVPCFLD